jgi:hypothetical protein
MVDVDRLIATYQRAFQTGVISLAELEMYLRDIRERYAQKEAQCESIAQSEQ